MNLTILKIFAIIIVLFSSVFGLKNEQIERLIKLYENQTEMREQYYKVLPENPCFRVMDDIVELRNIGLHRVRAASQINIGDTVENNGYSLIVNATITIDIPAIIKCTPRYKNDGSLVRYNNNDFLYYLILIKDDDDYDYARVAIWPLPEGNKTVFALEEAAVIIDLQETYGSSNNEQRKPIVIWFNKNSRPSKAKQRCVQLAAFGELTDAEPPGSWEILSGRIDVKSFILRVTKSVELRVRGIIECKVQIKTTKDAKPIKKTRYFCLSKPDYEDEKEHIFTDIYGPITIKGIDERIFALKKELL